MTRSASGPLQARTAPVVPEDWADWLACFEDATYFQSWPYGPLLWGPDRTGQLLLRDGEQVVAACRPWVRVLPVIRRGFAHVSWGPMWRLRGQALEAHVVECMLAALIEEFAQRRRLLLRIRFNVVADTPEGAMVTDIARSRGFVLHPREPAYRTYRLDLAPSLDDLRKGLRPKWRGHLNRSARQSLDIEQGTDLALMDRFRALYSELLERKGFTEYVADMDFFERMQAALPESQRMRVFLCTRDGVDLAGAVIPRFGDTAMYALGATSRACIEQKLAASYLVQWSVIEWLKSEGVRYYDLRGGLDDSMAGVRIFKEGLGGEEIRFLGSWEYCRDPLSRAVVHGGERLVAGVAALKQRLRGRSPW